MLNTEIQRLTWDDLCSALVFVGIYQFHRQSSRRRLVFVVVFFLSFPGCCWLSVSGISRCGSRDSMMSSPHLLSLLGVAVSWRFYAGRLSFLPFNTEGTRRKRDSQRGRPPTEPAYTHNTGLSQLTLSFQQGDSCWSDSTWNLVSHGIVSVT